MPDQVATPRPGAPRKQVIRDFHAGRYLDAFLVAGITAVLVIRLFLHVTGYPQVGGERFHVAHMLWGGLLMLVAIVLLLSYVGRRVHQLSAVVGGVGFGTFIDEVGKFVTQDNDYFFQPAVALIYVTFILTYLAARSLHRQRPALPEEYLVNALQELENVAVNDLDQEERDRALGYLERSDPGDLLVVELRQLLRRAALVPTRPPHPLVRLSAAATRLYRRLASRPQFPAALVAFFVAQLVVKAAHLVALLVRGEGGAVLGGDLPPVEQLLDGLDFADWAQIASAALSALFVLLGVHALRASRARALRMFQRSILVSIFLTQLFMFYRDQWSALTVLAFNLVVLAALNFVIDHAEPGAGPAGGSR
jgi:hypothetical protein